jgi:hypothetical protein
VALLDGVSSDKSRSGDSFMASLTEPIVANGKTVLATGTKIRGRVVDANDSGRVKGRASLALKLTEIVRENGKSVSISTKQYTAVAQPTKKRDAAIIGGGASGAAIGLSREAARGRHRAAVGRRQTEPCSQRKRSRRAGTYDVFHASKPDRDLTFSGLCSSAGSRPRAAVRFF